MWCVKCVEWKSCEIARPKFLSYLCKKILWAMSPFSLWSSLVYEMSQKPNQ